MHIGRRHTRTIVNGNGHAEPEEAVKPKRKYTRKAKSAKLEYAPVHYGLNYCNHCGMPLQAVKVALSLATT